MSEFHKILNRQIRKFFGDEEIPEDLRPFVEAVNRSYNNFEKDKLLSQHSFSIAEEEYHQMNEQLVAEKELQEEGVKSLLKSLKALDKDQYDDSQGDNDLLELSELLNQQIENQLRAEKRLQKLVKEVRKASQAKTEFLSVMSHEIRSPLNLIVGITQVLLNKRHLPEQEENLEVLRLSAKNLVNLINNILDFNKIEEGKVQLDKVNTNLMDLISDLQKANTNFARERHNSLALSIDEKLHPHVIADPLRLTQILSNLLSNALKFTYDGFVVLGIEVLKDANDHQSLRISIADSGIGISKKNQKKILTRFEQADQKVTREYGGTGLGLSITQSLLNLMGSSIQIESEEGKGAKFFFDLKLEKDLNAQSQLTVQKSLVEDLGGARILIVDDMALNLLLLREIIGDWNVELTQAKNGLEALELNQEQEFDLMIIDLHMPVMDGKTAAKEIRKIRKDMPIVALTASTGRSKEEILMEDFLDDYISKPFDPKQLYQCLEKLLESKPMPKA